MCLAWSTEGEVDCTLKLSNGRVGSLLSVGERFLTEPLFAMKADVHVLWSGFQLQSFTPQLLCPYQCFYINFFIGPMVVT